jgi:hypothetical protein
MLVPRNQSIQVNKIGQITHKVARFYQEVYIKSQSPLVVNKRLNPVWIVKRKLETDIKLNVGTKKSEHSGKQNRSDDRQGSQVLPGGMYQVQRILDSFWDRKQKKRFYRILWRGFGLKDATYELEEN